MMIWEKKSPHFREKCFVLSYLRGWRTFLTSRAWLLRNLSKRRKSEVQFILKIGQKRSGVYAIVGLWRNGWKIWVKVVRDSFGSNKMCQFFGQNLLFMAQAVRKWNNIRGSPCSIFQKMGPNIAIFDLLKYGVNGKTVTCLPLGSNFDNF